MAQIIQYRDRVDDASVYPITTAQAVYCNLDTDSSLCTLDNVLATKIEGQEIARIDRPDHDVKYVTTNADQGLSDIEKNSARENIGVNKLILDLSTNINSKALNIELKQDKLYHSQNPDDGNIKTINGVYILGPGNVDIYDNGIIGVDDSLSEDSSNAIMTSVVYREVTRIDSSLAELAEDCSVADASIREDISKLDASLRDTINDLPFISGEGAKSATLKNSTALGENAVATGKSTKAEGDNSFTTGENSETYGENSFAGGKDCYADGPQSFAFGTGIDTSSENEVGFGKYNRTYTDRTTFSIGNGESIDKRSNVMEITDGKLYFSGIGGYDGTNADDAYDISYIGTIQDVTYNELVNLQENGKLIPGKKYKIVDYTPKMKSEQINGVSICPVRFFDIIVTALSNDTLMEDAYAIKNNNAIYYDKDNVYGSINGGTLSENRDVILSKIYVNDDGTQVASVVPQGEKTITYERIPNSIDHIGRTDSGPNIYENNSIFNIAFSDEIITNNTLGANRSDFDEHNKLYKYESGKGNVVSNAVMSSIPIDLDPNENYKYTCSVGDIKTKTVTYDGITLTHIEKFTLKFDITVYDKSGNALSGTNNEGFTLTNPYTHNADSATIFGLNAEPETFATLTQKNNRYGIDERGMYPFYISNVFTNPNWNGNMISASISQIYDKIKNEMDSELEDLYVNFKDKGVIFMFGTTLSETIESVENDIMDKLYIYTTHPKNGGKCFYKLIEYPFVSTTQSIKYTDIKTSDMSTYTGTYGASLEIYNYQYYTTFNKKLFNDVNSDIIVVNDKSYYDGLHQLIKRPIKIKYSLKPISKYYDPSSTGEILEMTDNNGNHMYFDALSMRFYDEYYCANYRAFKHSIDAPYGENCKNIRCVNDCAVDLLTPPYYVFDNVKNVTLINSDDNNGTQLTSKDSYNVYLYKGRFETKQ